MTRSTGQAGSAGSGEGPRGGRRRRGARPKTNTTARPLPGPEAPAVTADEATSNQSPDRSSDQSPDQSPVPSAYALSPAQVPTTTTGQRTAKTTRQVLVTGTVDDVVATFPAQPDTEALLLDAPEVVHTRFSDRTVEQSIAFIRKTGIVEYVETLAAAQKAKAGRPALITFMALLVAMHLAVRDGRPLLLTELRNILHLRLSPVMQRLLDINPDPQPNAGPEAVKWDERTSATVRRAFHRLLSPIDPSVLPKNRERTWDEVQRLKKDLTVAEQNARAGALDWVCNQMLEAAYQQLPQQVRDRAVAQGLGYCIDGTVLPAFARGKGVNNVQASTDPDAGYYRRDGDHRDPHDTTEGGSSGAGDSRFKRTQTVVIWGREVHLVTLADYTHADRLYMPAIPFAFTTSIPAVDPAGGARRTFANIKARNHQPGWLAGDILYTQQKQEKYQIPAREEGYDLVLGYGVNHLGNQGAHASGMLLIEGGYHAPCIPDDLADATKDLREKRITLAEYNNRIRARVEYRMRNKETAKTSTRDIKERLACPASGPNPTAICALKPKSQNPRPTRQPDGALVDVRRTIDHRKVTTDGHKPKVCDQQTVTVSIEDGAKYRQTLQFGTKEHTLVYNRLRQSQEGVHGTAKDEAGVALANPGRRRVRGWAAQQLFAAFLLTETATRRITAFFRNHQIDTNGDMYVPRRPRTGGHATTNNPPGAPPVNDPPGLAA